MNTTEHDRQMAEKIRLWMVQHGQTLSTAESCTSGRVAATLTSVSGASDYYQGGIVVYQNNLKERFLEVNAETIATCDVVSEEVVRQMVAGCLQLFGTDYAIATTGYTGGGSEHVPAGTVWLGWGRREDIRTCRLQLSGDREANTRTAAETAVRSFLEML